MEARGRRANRPFGGQLCGFLRGALRSSVPLDRSSRIAFILVYSVALVRPLYTSQETEESNSEMKHMGLVVGIVAVGLRTPGN